MSLVSGVMTKIYFFRCFYPGDGFDEGFFDGRSCRSFAVSFFLP
jgi:hypothetical protein